MKDERPVSYDINSIDGFFSSNYFFASKFISKQDTILDSGCGTGYGISYLSDFTDMSCYGVDYENEVIETNKNHYRDNNKLNFHSIEKIQMPFPDDMFDVITSFEVIEHIDNYNDYIFELRRVLSPAGILILCTPNKEYFSPDLKNPVIVSHKKEFYPDEFIKVFNGKFKTSELYGKFFTESGLTKYQQLLNDNKYQIKISRFLARFNYIRKFAKKIPMSLRTKVSGGKVTPNYYRANDFIIEKASLEDFNNKISLSLIILCKV